MDSSTADEERLQNVSALAERAGVTSLAVWLARWGIGPVERALAYALAEPHVRNPAGLAYRLLVAGDAEHLPPPETETDAIAAARARYLAPVGWWQ